MAVAQEEIGGKPKSCILGGKEPVCAFNGICTIHTHICDRL